jgi:Right handed beta helix region
VSPRHAIRRTAAGAAGLLVLALAACSAAPAPHPRPSRTPGAPASSSPPAIPVAGSPPGCAAAGAVQVATASALTAALAGARPGERIVLAPGVYQGNFTAGVSGTAAAPITLCGGRDAVLSGGDIRHGYVLHLDKASWWRVEGFTVEDGQKGVVTDGVTHDLIDSLDVHTIGDEGIHLRSFSSDNIIMNSVVRQTGLNVQFFGEGIYVGSAHSNWCQYSNCQPDESNDNVIEGNTVSDTTAENVDIKEGTTGGTIEGNTFNGAGMVESAAKGWVNVKGNDWTIEGNTGVDSWENGYEVHQVYPGWGYGNVFRDNRADVNGSGYGIYVQSKHLNTIVDCNNIVTAAQRGFSPVACTGS